MNPDSHPTLSINVLSNRFFPFTIFRDLYVAYIDQLPLYNPPDILGLHSHAEMNYSIKTTSEILANMLQIQPEQDEMNDHSIDLISLSEQILQGIPPKKDLRLIKEKFRQRLSPLSFVLFQEIQQFNLLTSIMWKSITELKQALQGFASFSVQLDEINKSLQHGQIPSLWRSYAPQTKKSLANWLEHLQQRNQQYERWIHDGKKTN